MLLFTHFSIVMRHSLPALWVLVALGGARALPAQRVAPTVSIGLAMPAGGYSTNRRDGPVVRGGLAPGGPNLPVRWRLDGEVAWLPERGRTVLNSGTADGSLRSVALVGSLVAGPVRWQLAPYATLGAGPQWIRVRGSGDPRGAVTGIRFGVGCRFRGERTSWLAEVALQAALSKFGTNGDFAVGSYVPFTVGVAF